MNGFRTGINRKNSLGKESDWVAPYHIGPLCGAGFWRKWKGGSQEPDYSLFDYIGCFNQFFEFFAVGGFPSISTAHFLLIIIQNLLGQMTETGLGRPVV